MSNTLPALRNTFIQNQDGYDLEKVIEWSEKFERQQQGKHPPFDAHDLVRVKGFIEYDDDGLKLHVDAGGRVADNFYLVNPVDPEQAKIHGGLPLESVVRVLNLRKQNFQISNIQNYTAALVDITSLPSINPTVGEANTTSNTQAVVYGEFVGFKENGEDRFIKSLGFPEGTRISGENSSGKKVHLSITLPDGEKTSVNINNPPEDYHEKATHAIVRTEDGREIEVYNPTGKIVYSGGTTENISGKLPEQGDILRISAEISEGKFFAHWCDPCFLVDPSEQRFSKTENLRLTLDENLERTSQYIDSGQHSEARAVLAEVRAKEVTEAQLDRTYQLAQQIPEAERPMLTDKKEYSGSRNSNYLVDKIDRAFGIRLESMTADEFTTFAKGALAGDIQETGDHSDTTYLLSIAPDMGFDLQYIEDLAVHAIQGRIKKMVGKAKQEFDDEHVVGQAVNTIYHSETPNAARIISDTISKLQAESIKLPYDVKNCSEKLLQNISK